MICLLITKRNLTIVVVVVTHGLSLSCFFYIMCRYDNRFFRIRCYFDQIIPYALNIIKNERENYDDDNDNKEKKEEEKRFTFVLIRDRLQPLVHLILKVQDREAKRLQMKLFVVVHR